MFSSENRTILLGATVIESTNPSGTRHSLFEPNGSQTYQTNRTEPSIRGWIEKALPPIGLLFQASYAVCSPYEFT